MKHIVFRQIGVIKTPYSDSAPYQPVDRDKGNFRIVINSAYTKGLNKLERFRYIYVIYHINRLERRVSLKVCPPWTSGLEIGLFASRSPLRPNPIGLSVVRIKRIVRNEIITSGMDVFDGTPLLDIKPYIKDLDSKCDSNYGWVDDLEDKEHISLHIRGIPHDY